MGGACDILVVIAHPDDEIFVSGTMCLCAERGFSIVLVCVTDGEGGSRDLLFQGSSLRLEEIRRKELRLSAWVLGSREVCFLSRADVPIPNTTGEGGWDQPSTVEALERIIRVSDPQLILTHGPQGGYGHPAHRLVYHCVAAAAQADSFRGSIFSFCARVEGAFFSWHFDQPSDVHVDARGFLLRRTASLSYHQSQISYFVQPHFPRSIRKIASALFGYTFAFTAAGRKRVPIATPQRFFRRFPVEGLALQKPPKDGRPHFFREHYLNDDRVRINR